MTATPLTLHIGTPKSGTTHLQAVLSASRADLRRHGVLYPGAGYLPKGGLNQQPAIYALAGPTLAWVDDRVRRSAVGYFDRLCDEISGHRGRLLVSAESLAFFDVGSIRQVLRRWGIGPEDVSVLITTRDYGRLLPSIWQQNVKNGATQRLQPYLDSVAALRGNPESSFWTAFGLPRLVARWSSVVGPGRITLVTAPRRGAGPEELWRRFATAARLPSAVVEGATQPSAFDDNVSLTPSQVELVRALNGVLRAGGWTRGEQQRTRARLLGIWMSEPAEPGGQRIQLPVHLQEIVSDWAGDDVRQLKRQGVPVVGDLTDLLPRFDPVTTVCAPAGPTVDEAVARDVLSVLMHDREPAFVDRSRDRSRPRLWAWLRRPAGAGPTSDPGLLVRQPAIRHVADLGPGRRPPAADTVSVTLDVRGEERATAGPASRDD